MDADENYFLLHDEATHTIRFGLALADGKRVDVEMEEGWQRRKAGKRWTEIISRTKEPILIATKAAAGAWHGQAGRDEYTNVPIWPLWMGVPMMVGEKVLGVIASRSLTREYVYGGDELELLPAIANQAATALDNIRLYEHMNNCILRGSPPKSCTT